MNQKGELLLTVFAAAVIVLTISAAVITVNKGDKVYIGDKKQMNFIEYGKCPAKMSDIPELDRIIFESANQAKANGFTVVEGCT